MAATPTCQRPMVFLQRDLSYQRRPIALERRTIPGGKGITIAALEEFLNKKKSKPTKVQSLQKKTRVLRSERMRELSAATLEPTISIKTEKPKKASKNLTKMPLTLKTNFWVGLYVLAAILVPQVLLLHQPLLGLYAATASLISLLVLALCSERARKLAIAVSVLPLATLVSLSFPQSDTFAQTEVFYIALLSLTFMTGITYGLEEPIQFSIASKRYLKSAPLMIVIGEVVGVLGYALLCDHYAFRGVPILQAVMAIVTFAVAEEMLFRGMIQRQAARVVHPIVAAVLAAALYTTIFIGHTSALNTSFALVAGTVLSVVYYFKPHVLLTTTANIVMKLSYFGLIATFILR